MASDTSSDSFDAQSFISRRWQTVTSEIGSGAADGHLEDVRRAETARDSGGRPSVLEALNARRDELRDSEDDAEHVEENGEPAPPGWDGGSDANVDQDAPNESDPMGYTDGEAMGPRDTSDPGGETTEDAEDEEEECGNREDDVPNLKPAKADTPETESKSTRASRDRIPESEYEGIGMRGLITDGALDDMRARHIFAIAFVPVFTVCFIISIVIFLALTTELAGGRIIQFWGLRMLVNYGAVFLMGLVAAIFGLVGVAAFLFAKR